MLLPSLIIFGVALPLYVLGLFFVQRKRAFLKIAKSVPGTVIDLGLHLVYDTDDKTEREMSTPIVRFVTEEGETIEFESSVSSAPPSYTVGQQITVVYDPAQPSKAEIRSFWSLWLVPLVFFFIAAIITFIGMIFALVGSAGG